MRVLVVEDEVTLARSLARGLRAEGIAVDLAHDGITGRDAAMRGHYDVVVLDIMLPGMHGYRVVKELRAAGLFTPVLMLTAKDGEYDEADAFDLGADDYLTKPFSYVVLVARIRALLRRNVEARPTVLAAGDVALDPATHKVTLADEPVSLTPREYGVLEYLMRNPSRVVTKIEILDHVWDRAAEVDPNVVEVYVGYLRRKLGKGLVETVRGAGYRLDR
jgi:DNA-binding response OmpR family regulator